MEVLRSPRGLIIDLITPLKRGGEIDGRGLGKQLDRMLPHVHALLLASPYMGEGNHLKPTQREELLEKAIVVVRGRVPILVWISQNTEDETRETLALLKKRLEIRNYKGSVFWVDTPLYYHSNRGLPQYYRNLSSNIEDSIILHNDPELIKPQPKPLKRNNIRTSILKDLAQIDNIRGLIFVGSLDRANNYQKAVRSRSDFRIYDGDESHFLSHPSVSGVISRGANLAPKAWQKITTSSLNRSGDQKDYPDYLKQIWEVGGYLSDLKNIYDSFSVP
ncbi:MAG: dihydrodipicolinate synthase family protein, partial [Deltaproteobacteria bacterium]|nr:dihydrodipicolinate synthase family protein [Deltaproteobacteria bacterium]